MSLQWRYFSNTRPHSMKSRLAITILHFIGIMDTISNAISCIYIYFRIGKHKKQKSTICSLNDTITIFIILISISYSHNIAAPFVMMPHLSTMIAFSRVSVDFSLHMHLAGAPKACWRLRRPTTPSTTLVTYDHNIGNLNRIGVWIFKPTYRIYEVVTVHWFLYWLQSFPIIEIVE